MPECSTIDIFAPTSLAPSTSFKNGMTSPSMDATGGFFTQVGHVGVCVHPERSAKPSVKASDVEDGIARS